MSQHTARFSGTASVSKEKGAQEVMKHTLELQENLWVKQAEVTEIRTEGGAVSGVATAAGAVYAVKAAVIATGGRRSPGPGGPCPCRRWRGCRAYCPPRPGSW